MSLKPSSINAPASRASWGEFIGPKRFNQSLLVFAIVVLVVACFSLDASSELKRGGGHFFHGEVFPFST